MRRRRPPSRLGSILVIVALLWSQVAYALHGGCVAEASAFRVAAPRPHIALAHAKAADATPPEHHCKARVPTADEATCELHCATPASSNDIARIPPIPALLPAGITALPIVTQGRREPAPAVRPDVFPRVRMRGPTGHPALLLLI